VGLIIHFQEALRRQSHINEHDMYYQLGDVRSFLTFDFLIELDCLIQQGNYHYYNNP